MWLSDFRSAQIGTSRGMGCALSLGFTGVCASTLVLRAKKGYTVSLMWTLRMLWASVPWWSTKPLVSLSPQPAMQLLLTHSKKGAKFNHSARTWLVLWEAKVIIQLPPWVVVLYPSSLIYHFNIDISGERAHCYYQLHPQLTPFRY